MVRQLLELQPGGRLRRIAVVGKQIAPADFQRVHADLGGGQFDQPFGHRHRERMADGAVLAHHIFIGEHHARLRAIIRAGVGAADQIDHLVRLDARGARIDRVGADAGQVVDLEGGDGAVVLDADFRLHAVIAGVDVGDEALDAVGDEFHRPLEQLGQRHRRHLVGIGVHLDAERAADVFRQHAHLLVRQAEVLGEQVLHHVRRLRALVHRHALLARIPVGHDRARLVGDAGVAAEQEGGLDHRVRAGEGLVDFADIELALETEIVAERGVNYRRLGIERGFRIDHRRQFLVCHLDQFAGIFGLGARARDHGADGFALPAGDIDGDGRLRRRFEALEMREHADPGRHDFRQLGTGDHGDHAGRFLRRVGFDADDARVCMRRAHESHMRHARQRDIADILPAPLREPLQIRPRHRAADIRVRPVEGAEHGRGVVGDFHRFAPARACATDSTASTMAW